MCKRRASAERKPFPLSCSTTRICICTSYENVGADSFIVSLAAKRISLAKSTAFISQAALLLITGSRNWWSILGIKAVKRGKTTIKDKQFKWTSRELTLTRNTFSFSKITWCIQWYYKKCILEKGASVCVWCAEHELFCVVHKLSLILPWCFCQDGNPTWEVTLDHNAAVVVMVYDVTQHKTTYAVY